jgi:hypothetical protein
MKSKKLTTSDPDLAAWCKALASPIIEDTVPPGWFTTRQLAKSLGKGESRMGHILCAAVLDGRAEKKNFRITSGQVTRPVPHYRLLK